jgi:hypothetical protein
MGRELSNHANCLLLGMGRPAIPSGDDARRALKIDALLGRELRWLAASEKPAMPHAGFIK